MGDTEVSHARDRYTDDARAQFEVNFESWPFGERAAPNV